MVASSNQVINSSMDIVLAGANLSAFKARDTHESSLSAHVSNWLKSSSGTGSKREALA